MLICILIYILFFSSERVTYAASITNRLWGGFFILEEKDDPDITPLGSAHRLYVTAIDKDAIIEQQENWYPSTPAYGDVFSHESATLRSD